MSERRDHRPARVRRARPGAGCSSYRRSSSSGLAIFVAFLPVLRLCSSTRHRHHGRDRGFRPRARGTVDAPSLASSSTRRARRRLRARPGRRCRRGHRQVNDRELDAALVASRLPSGQLVFSFHLGETMGQPQIQQPLARRVRRRGPRLQRAEPGVRVPAARRRDPACDRRRAAARSHSTRPRSRAG